MIHFGRMAHQFKSFMHRVSCHSLQDCHQVLQGGTLIIKITDKSDRWWVVAAVL